MNINAFIELSVNQNASDLHFCVGHFPAMRIAGNLHFCNTWSPVGQQWMETLCQQLLDDTQRSSLQQHHHIDFACQINGNTRLRGHFFHQQQGLSVTFRLLPAQCPTLESLHIPAIVTTLIMQKNGLILISGPTGSGKSTTLAAIIHTINQQCQKHIITLEDPIEFIHKSQNCLIQQRELGCHTHSLADGLHALLREDPDIILLGELRDAESIRMALAVAETGHLVLATLHTANATQAIDRLAGVFSAQEKIHIQAQIAGNLLAVIAQKLKPRQAGGQIAIFEILTNTTAVSNLIREGKTHQLQNILQTSSQSGMQTFAQGLQQRQKEGFLSDPVMDSLQLNIVQTSFPE